MRFVRALPGLATALVLAAGVLAQDGEVSERSAPPPPVPAESPNAESIPLHGERGDENHEQWETFFGQLIVRNVNLPSIYPVLPESADRNGKAVLILPGGGYQFISMQSEGSPLHNDLPLRDMRLSFPSIEPAKPVGHRLSFLTTQASLFADLALHGYKVFGRQLMTFSLRLPMFMSSALNAIVMDTH